MTEEIWRPVVGYEGLYEVSSYGRVRSLDRYVKYSNGRINLHKGRILSPGKDTKIKNGYWTGLSKKDLGKREYDHQYYLKRKAGL